MKARAQGLRDALVGRRAGIVRRAALAECIDGDARLVHVGLELADAHPGLGGERLRVGGAGLTADEALVCALAEGVERYVASTYDPRGILATRADLGARALDPSTFGAFGRLTRAQPGFPYVRADDDTPLRWVAGLDLSTREPVFVPAFAVYMPYVPHSREVSVDASVTTGLACAPTIDDAFERGAREVIERDAVSLLWMLGLTPPQIAARELGSIAGGLLPPRDDVRAYDLTTDLGLAVYLVVCRGEGPRGSLLSVGAACAPEPASALRKAALEASQDRVYVRLLVDEEPDWQPATDFGNVTDFSRHARLYSGRPELARRGLAHLDEGTELALRVPGPSSALEALARAGHRAIGVDLTPQWASAMGLAVARVVVPDLLPLHGSHLLRYEAHPRLRATGRAMPGAVKRHDRAFWPYPHAMP